MQSRLPTLRLQGSRGITEGLNVDHPENESNEDSDDAMWLQPILYREAVRRCYRYDNDKSHDPS